jgi:adenylate cyclase
MRYNFACVLAAHLGDKDRAIRMLESTLPFVGEYQVRIAETDTDFDTIRDDPRFEQMISAAKKRLGIAEAADPPAAELSR